jgi:nucleoside-diphosphate-sugar epimerase
LKSATLKKSFISTPGKILVTGGTGFLGAYISRELVMKGYQVRAIRRSNKLPFFIEPVILEKIEWVEGDVLDVVSLEDAMEGVSAVVHAAAVVSFLRRERKRMYQVNVDGTANVVNIALEKNVRKVVHISSVAALGRTPGGGHVDEEKKWEETRVNTHYARSKQKAELQVWRGISEGLEAVILNPSTILGYGDWNTGSCAIFKNIYNGFNWYTPGINGFVDVEDVAKVTVRVLEEPVSEQRFIVNGDNWTFKKLQETIAAGFGKPGPKRAATPWMLSLGWKLERLRSAWTRKKPLLTPESVRVAISKTYFDNKKILEALPGFAFTPLEVSIGRACRQYLDHPVNKLVDEPVPSG